VRVNVQRPAFGIPLVRAVLGLPDDGLACDECQAWLPAYVDAEVGGLSDHARYLPVKRHLLLCSDCAIAYLELLDLALAEEQGRIPQLTYYPEPDLSFLPGECSDERPRKE
jgi:hypothetical protein